MVERYNCTSTAGSWNNQMSVCQKSVDGIVGKLRCQLQRTADERWRVYERRLSINAGQLSWAAPSHIDLYRRYRTDELVWSQMRRRRRRHQRPPARLSVPAHRRPSRSTTYSSRRRLLAVIYQEAREGAVARRRRCMSISSSSSYTVYRTRH